eukprot:COSAG06_NODE_39151_length_415_cov_4.715190_1_plen_134_part_10
MDGDTSREQRAERNEVNEAPSTYDDWLEALEATVGCKPANYTLKKPFASGQAWKGALYEWGVREGVDPPPLEELVQMLIEEREDEGEDLQDMLDDVLEDEEDAQEKFRELLQSGFCGQLYLLHELRSRGTAEED